MYELQEHHVQCPYCGEIILLFVDSSQKAHSYIEDCSVCCEPININILEDQEKELFVVVTNNF